MARNDLCSGENTSNQQPTTSLYMTDGLCFDTCKASFAYGLVRGQQCYCSNVAPGDTVNVSECSDPCIGYPQDLCGNVGAGLFRYVQIGTPTSTAPSTSSSSSSSSSSLSSSSSSASSSSSDSSSSSVSSSSSSSGSSSSSAPNASSSVIVAISTVYLTPSPSAGSDPSSSTSPIVSIVTVYGPATTQTVLPSASPTLAAANSAQTSDASLSETPSNSFFSDPGKVAAVFTIVGVVLAVILGLGLFFCMRRRRNQSRQVVEDDINSLTGDTIVNSSSKRSRSSFGLFNEKTSGLPSSTRTPSDEGISPQVDQRLDPRSFVLRFEDNYSSTSLRDDEDYSRRVLHVANPD